MMLMLIRHPKGLLFAARDKCANPLVTWGAFDVLRWSRWSKLLPLSLRSWPEMKSSARIVHALI